MSIPNLLHCIPVLHVCLVSYSEFTHRGPRTTEFREVTELLLEGACKLKVKLEATSSQSHQSNQRSGSRISERVVQSLSLGLTAASGPRCGAVAPMELEQPRQPARRWARTLGEMRQELGLPATPLGASALLAEFDGDVEATPLIKALQKHVAGRPQLLPKQKPNKPAPKAYSTPVVGGAEAALDVLRKEHNGVLRQMAGLQERAAKHDEQMRDQERRHAKLLVEERTRLKEMYNDQVRSDLTACRDLQRRLQSAPAATIADMDEQMRRREKIADNSIKRAETLWNTERANLQQQLEAQKTKNVNDTRRWEKIDKKTEARLATALANVKSLKLELAEEHETVKSMKLELEEERSDRAALEVTIKSLEDKRAPTTAPTSSAAVSLNEATAHDVAHRNAHEADETVSVNLDDTDEQSLGNTADVYVALLRSQSKLQATSAELAVCRKSLRHEQAAAARDRMKLAAFEAKRAKEIAKQRCSHCGQRAAVHPDDHHGPVALADPARGASPAHLGKMAVGQWRGRDREELQKLCMQVLGAARLAVGMPAVDPQLAETMSAMQRTWASAMQGEIEPNATLLLRSKSSGEDGAGSSEVPFGCRTDANDQEHAAAARIQGLVRGKKERRRQRDLNADLAVEGLHETGGSERVQLLSNLVSSLSARPSPSNPRKTALANGEAEFDAKFKLRSATRSIAMAIAASARLVAGSAQSDPCVDVEQQPEALPEVVEAVQAVVDKICVQENEALGGYVVRIVGAQGLAPLTSSSNTDLSNSLAAFLPPPDVNAFAVVYVNGVWAGETNVALQTVAPLWNAEIVLRGAAMLHGSSPPSGAGPNSIAVALFDYQRKGEHAFLGQMELNADHQGDPSSGSLAGLPTQDAAEMPLRPHPTHPKARVRGSVLLRVCPAEGPQATFERKFTRKRSAASSAPFSGWSDELMVLANGALQDESGCVTEAEKEWMDVRAAANAGDLAMRRWWSHTIDDEPGSKWLYDLVRTSALQFFSAISHSFLTFSCNMN
eukprot:COSAG02_NODE_3086_length_7385_cov_371.477111_2_plen_1009_part_00